MSSSFVSRLGTSPEEGVKAPCVVATLANITLSGEQTIDSVPVVAGDRVLVKSQTNPAENGIYVVSAGAWSRSKDWNAAEDLTSGILVPISSDGFVYQGVWSGDFEVGVTEPTFNTSAITGSAITGKTIDLGENVLTGSLAEFNAALQGASFATLAGSETLTSKNINLANNTLVGTLAQFNTALQSDNFATLGGAQTFTGVNTFSAQVLFGAAPKISFPDAHLRFDDTDGAEDSRYARIYWYQSGFLLRSMQSDDSTTKSNLLAVGESVFTYKGNTVWHSGNDGYGSGLDADTLAGIQATRLATHDHVNGTDYATQIVGDITYVKASNYMERTPSGAGKKLRCVAYVSVNIYEDTNATATAFIRPGYVNSSDVETETGREYEVKVQNTGGSGDMSTVIAIPFDLASTQVTSTGTWKPFIYAKAGSTSDNIDIDEVTMVFLELFE